MIARFFCTMKHVPWDSVVSWDKKCCESPMSPSHPIQAAMAYLFYFGFRRGFALTPRIQLSQTCA